MTSLNPRRTQGLRPCRRAASHKSESTWPGRQFASEPSDDDASHRPTVFGAPPRYLPTVPGDVGAPPTPRAQTYAGTEYVNGGAGEESRTAMARMQPGFPLRLVFSDRTGEYIVADHVDVKNGATSVLNVDKAGPLLLVKLAPGRYTIDATYAGRTEQRSVFGQGSRTVNWSWPVVPVGTAGGATGSD